MNATSLKDFFKTKFGLRGVRVHSGSSFVKVWIPGTLAPNGMSISWPLGCEFPASLRQRCLGAIYGEESALAKQTSAGNVEAHSIAMHRSQWGKSSTATVSKNMNIKLMQLWEQALKFIEARR